MCIAKSNKLNIYSEGEIRRDGVNKIHPYPVYPLQRVENPCDSDLTSHKLKNPLKLSSGQLQIGIYSRLHQDRTRVYQI